MSLPNIPSPEKPARGKVERSGVALMGAIAAIVMVGVFAAAIISFHMATRRTIDQAQRTRQVEYLARSGIEFAISELLKGRDEEFRETYQPLENSQVRIRVVPDADEPGLVQISSQAEMTRHVQNDQAENKSKDEKDKNTIVREITRRYRLIHTDADGIGRYEFVSFVDFE